MKKTLLFLTFAISQGSIAQLPTPVYEHSFTETLQASDFTVGSGISLTSDRDNNPNRAANLVSGHEALSLDITANKTALMQQGSISLWFKYEGTGLSAFGNNKPLVFWSNGNNSYSEGIMFSLASSGQIGVISYQNSSVGGFGFSTTTSAADGQWHNFVVTWQFGSSGFVKGYLDGNHVITLDVYHQLDDALDTIFFTGFNTTYPSSLYGSIDDINVYTEILTDTQIGELATPAELCEVNIPDANFRNAILSYNAVDTNGNGIIECHEAAAFTGHLLVGASQITSLAGLEAFTGVTYINCSANQITSANFGLNPNLVRIDCNANQFTNLDFTNNLALEILNCGENQITQLDISANTQVYSFNSTGSPYLTGINIANGNNASFFEMKVAGSPNLTCIQVDNPSFSTNNWAGENFNKPSAAVYSTNCNLNTSDFETLKLEVYPNPTNGIVNISEVANITVFDIQGRKITESKNVTSFDLSSQAQGIYFAQITTEKGTETIKIVRK